MSEVHPQKFAFIGERTEVAMFVYHEADRKHFKRCIKDLVNKDEQKAIKVKLWNKERGLDELNSKSNKEQEKSGLTILNAYTLPPEDEEMS